MKVRRCMQMENSSKENCLPMRDLTEGADDGCSALELSQRYDQIYNQFEGNEDRCPVSTGNLPRARRRVRQVLRGLGLTTNLRGARVLDIGSGLGVTAEAFRELGAMVTGIDLSAVAVSLAKARFREIDFRCLGFPSGLHEDHRFDLIWATDLPVVGLGAYDTQRMQRELLGPCLRLLNSEGHLVIGWHTDFSGQEAHGWLNWSLSTIRESRNAWRASPALIPQARFFWLSTFICHVCRVLQHSAPIYFRIRASDWR